MYTMRDVARLANVSVATVSAVVNGKKGVSVALTTRVEAALKALNFHPNHVARSLRVRQSTTIGVVIPTMIGLFMEAVRGAEDAARTAGYSVLLCNSNEDIEQEQRHLGALFSRRVDGVLLATADPNSFGSQRYRPNVPIVLFDRVPPGYAGPAVVVNNISAAYEATRYLISQGHHRIGFIAGRQNVSTGSERAEGFRKAMAEANLPVRDDYFKQGNFKLDSGHQAGLELFHLAEPPTAIFSSNAAMTLGLLKAMRDIGVRYPEDASVLGFDDLPSIEGFSLGLLTNPALTVLAQPEYEIGRRAAALLLNAVAEAMNGDEVHNEGIVVLKADLCVRNSVAGPSRRAA